MENINKKLFYHPLTVLLRNKINQIRKQQIIPIDSELMASRFAKLGTNKDDFNDNNNFFSLHFSDLSQGGYQDLDDIDNPSENIIPTEDPFKLLTNFKRLEPYFDPNVNSNVTALVGKSAYLNCIVKNLGNKTVEYRGCFYRLFIRQTLTQIGSITNRNLILQLVERNLIWQTPRSCHEPQFAWSAWRTMR